MARQFEQLFDRWASSYDRSVSGHDIQYREVFSDYERILDEVAKRANGVVLEFGVGTGNLTQKLLQQGRRVYGIEPSRAMRQKAREKLQGVPLFDGDFLYFPKIDDTIHTIVSTYAFHHITDRDKGVALRKFSDFLSVDGKIVFADTVFESERARQAMIEKVEKLGYDKLLADLRTEYYTTIEKLQRLFVENGFQKGRFTQMNAFVWLFEAHKA